MVVSMGIPRPVDLKRASGLTPIRIAQVRKYAAVLFLELFDWIERAGDQTFHPRIQCAAGDEQERKARTNLRIEDSCIPWRNTPRPFCAFGACHERMGRLPPSSRLSLQHRNGGPWRHMYSPI